MKDLNSLEQFNQLYRHEKEAVFARSLLDFFQTSVAPRLMSNGPKVLDLGPGTRSIFEETALLKSNITALDFSDVAVEKANSSTGINYILGDISEPGILKDHTFDLIFDSHCLHCLLDPKKREQAIINIYQALANEGLFCAEMMVQSPGKKADFPMKYVPDARTLEEEILGHGFKILYFMIVPGLAFANGGEECDLLRVIARK